VFEDAHQYCGDEPAVLDVAFPDYTFGHKAAFLIRPYGRRVILKHIEFHAMQFERVERVVEHQLHRLSPESTVPRCFLEYGYAHTRLAMF
jgi:hypothetical protein